MELYKRRLVSILRKEFVSVLRKKAYRLAKTTGVILVHRRGADQPFCH